MKEIGSRGERSSNKSTTEDSNVRARIKNGVGGVMGAPATGEEGGCGAKGQTELRKKNVVYGKSLKGGVVGCVQRIPQKKTGHDKCPDGKANNIREKHGEIRSKRKKSGRGENNCGPARRRH